MGEGFGSRLCPSYPKLTSFTLYNFCKEITMKTFILSALSLIALFAPAAVVAQKTVGKYADVNGIKLYYEIHGTGKPLVLLHGGLFSTSLFGPTLPALAANRQVIAVDMQGHGHTAD